MTQNKPDLAHWFITDDYRALAKIKFQVKQLESRLNKYLNVESDFKFFPAEANTLCHALAHKYLDYLKLIDESKKNVCSELPMPNQLLNWQKQYQLILHLKQQLSKTTHLEEECQLITEIASLYYHFNQLTAPPLLSNTASEHSEELKKIFRKEDLQSWLTAVVDFWNESNAQSVELSSLFHEWNPQQLQVALDYFSAPELVNLVNAMFFYKLYPDKLFKELIHPEKLVSVRARVGLLHHYIELLENHLYSTALQQGLKPEVDYLLHGDELPQGIMIEVDEEFKAVIQEAIKKVKVKYTHESEEQVTLERLHDLGRAYKFWFNPNRLIDAVMVLQQRLVKDDIAEENKLSVFRQKMILLYEQLSTTECLDLYGYFANNDSRYLLYTLFTIDRGHLLDWLPALNSIEKNAITRVFQALQCVMEALRDELKIRHAATEPYVYDLAKQQIHTGRRNRDAVFRIIAIYGSETVTLNNTVEELFNFIENTGQESQETAK
ncbi:hypothetical protein [Legionella maioricensis]|uniref:Uncharacterized protein n=1 Tax=Legionella maioricensis TaxID=2896528 RepID=A0A9X2IC02_9GAMM|nr:hypothetical protein [Legionella maioricensis]MCL9683902.1 hypothetical protein [Legionella maioricensis]MCL9686749.1 hypothetical protein [Legionella maioricensis]